MQSAKKSGAPRGNSPQEMVLSTGRHFVFTQILITVISMGLIFLPYPIIYYLPRAFPTRSADFFEYVIEISRITEYIFFVAFYKVIIS